MGDTLAHRGPDARGTWVDGPSGIALAHTRLAIVDLAPTGRQPMVSADGRWVVVFNGELYDHDAMRDELRGLGATFRGGSDTEVLVEGIARWGLADTLRRTAGMFAIAAWDRRRRTLSLARDRFGEKPLYVSAESGTLRFGSELRALRADPTWRGEIDPQALGGFFRHGFVPGCASIYRGVRKVPPATILSYDTPGDSPATCTYWSLADVAVTGLNDDRRRDDHPDAWCDALDRTLTAAVDRQMRADVPLGALLSGGIDSSLVVALMQRQTHRAVRTFSIGFDDPTRDEAPHARAIAEHLGTEHTELYVSGRDALELVPSLPAIYDEPFADSSQVPTALLARLVRRHVTVALAGDGGDELFGGYVRYAELQRLWRRLAPVPHVARRVLARTLAAVPVRAWDALLAPVTGGRPRGDRVHKLAGFLDASTPDALYARRVSHWRAPQALVLGLTNATETVVPGADRLAHAPTLARLMYRDAVTYLPDDILVKVDRAAMAASLEVRAPFLDHRVAETAWRIPADHVTPTGGDKWVLRRLLARYVPPSLFERPKRGFGVPLAAWLRGPLRAWADDLLAGDRLRADGLLDPSPIQAMWSSTRRGERHWHYLLWDVLMFQAWLDHQRRPPAMRLLRDAA